MRVLAIDSSGLTATVAVVEDDQTIAEYTTNYKKTHSQTLLPMIDEMVKMIDADLTSIDAIAVSGGPGSFTGLRIGVPTVEAMAYSMYGCEDIICPLMDARRKQVYTGLYSFSHRKKEEAGLYDEPVFQILRTQMAVSVEELIRHLNVYRRRVVFLGDGVPVYKEMLTDGLKVPYWFAPSFMNRQRAAAVGSLGIRYYEAGRYESAAEFRPEYLRKSQAERERAEREKNAVPQVRRMTCEDGAAVAEMEHQLFSDAWSEKSILETLEQPNSICLIVEKAGRITGYLLAYKAADEAEIARIAVVKEFQRQGAARALLAELEAICGSDGINRILLDVRSGNAAARSLYESAGFKEDGIRQRFYENPVEDAVLMSRDLPAVPTVNRAEISI